jgi:CheY-like chemotaxis protein
MVTASTPASIKKADAEPKKLLLLVDDEVDITDTLGMLLRLHGYEVRTASNGVEAMVQMGKRVPNIVISDCMMPVMSGLELCSKIRRNPTLKNIPIILCSGAPERHDLTGVQFNVFLRKPYSFDKLASEIVRLLAA